MNDRSKIFLGLGLFLVLAAFPVWYSAAGSTRDRNGDGKPDYGPMPVRPAGSGECIESREFMRASHMDLLTEWRDSVVRDDDYVYVAKKDGKHWQRSLSGTCMSCHTNEEKFCGECHTYMGVVPNCWTCHVRPEQSKGAAVPVADGRK
jgi:hypothetical protein